MYWPRAPGRASQHSASHEPLSPEWLSICLHVRACPVLACRCLHRSTPCCSVHLTLLGSLLPLLVLALRREARAPGMHETLKQASLSAALLGQIQKPVVKAFASQALTHACCVGICTVDAFYGCQVVAGFMTEAVKLYGAVSGMPGPRLPTPLTFHPLKSGFPCLEHSDQAHAECSRRKLEAQDSLLLGCGSRTFDK